MMPVIFFPTDKAFDFQKNAFIDFYLGEKSILGQRLDIVALKPFVQNIFSAT
ncbi:TPA: hypothetical protein NR353_001593 [Legionella pneumophila]|uniref:hypothetical protein n=1 Tax=Legionella TaxID=445 RepID=UPI000347D0B0|nr:MULTISPECIES: hypothetical protein [Legionella]MBN5936055.1 hypothetical protein [Legionella anisa]HCJ1082920.1 hypothetical protein [Legionella pneumophila]HCJ4379445.1 hypothetical protein [Legionella pneumophila]HEM6754207.1 hypothetical protein [Legionella pneumophila]HEM6931552.1 hypothetical protein [Legionella pneumophila]